MQRGWGRVVVLQEEQLDEIGAIARLTGWGAADILQDYYQVKGNRHLAVKQKKEGPVTAADIAANDYILRQLRIAVGSEDFGYLSEEMKNASPLPQSWVWIIDPIDGTNAFINRTGQYAIHIALVFKGRPAVAVVVVPESGKLYYARRGGGAFVENRAGKRTVLQVSTRDRLEDLSLVVSRSLRNRRFQKILYRLPGRHTAYIGSIGCRIAAIVDGGADAYISTSGKSAPKDWDLAAPELILTEAGGKFTHLDGTPLTYNQGDINQWGFLIGSNGCCHAALSTRIQSICAEIDGGV
ncbi:MAG: 3'(2'),5'-bisphosphate nucleotidase CysQ [Oscillatoria sp. SIO1A7]|nr:3'(2'),5'-bisphosphate nucleotidase CysQ [Oscillatoria sp. SIO1A7]